MPEIAKWILGILLTALIGSLAYRNHKARERFTKFADDFKSAFLPAITQLNTRLGSDREVLGDEFNRHRDAAIVFKEHLGFRKAAFEKAWQAYEAHCKERTDVPMTFFIGTEILDMSKAGDPQHIQEVKEMRRDEALSHINNLLKFAKPKH
jgi:hypothetical protein